MKVIMTQHNSPPYQTISCLALSDIIILPSRNRGEFPEAKAHELRDSIAARGLLHPIRVSPKLELVCGERRLRAVRELGRVRFCGEWYEGTIPAIITEHLSEDDALEEELHENVYRLDITWQRRVEGFAKLHAMRLRDNPTQTIKATVAETPLAPDFAQDAVIVAQHLSDPNIANAPSLREARSRVLAKAERAAIAEIARRTAARALTTPTEDRFRLIEGDCYEVLANVSALTFDVCITDPPYGISASSQNLTSQGTSRRSTENLHQYDDSETTFARDMPRWASAITSVMKERAQLFWFCEQQNFEKIWQELLDLNWKVYPRPIIWSKGTMTAGNAMLWPARSYECILFATRGDRPIQGSLRSDLIEMTPDRDKVHAAQKPVALYRELLSWSVLPGDNVLDPFCGSGTVIEAARQLMCRATAIDLDTKVARERMGGVR
jgi:DNA modification methylase